MYEGKTLEALPRSYRLWLINDKVYEGKPELKAALIAAGYLQTDSDPLTPPSTPKRNRPVADFDETDLPVSIARKRALSDIARRNGTMLNYDGSAYMLTFGTYRGETLRDVPSSYIDWLIKRGVHNELTDLAAALREEGFLASDNCASPSRTIREPRGGDFLVSRRQTTYDQSDRQLPQSSRAGNCFVNPHNYLPPH